MKKVKRTLKGDLDGLKQLVIYGWETARRYMSHLTRNSDVSVIQIALMVDLKGAGIGNLVSPPQWCGRVQNMT